MSTLGGMTLQRSVTQSHFVYQQIGFFTDSAYNRHSLYKDIMNCDFRIPNEICLKPLLIILLI